MQYQECSSPCADTCTNPERSQFCEEHCMDGCFCPPGKFLCTHISNPKEQQQLTCRIWVGSMGFKPPAFAFFTAASDKHYHVSAEKRYLNYCQYMCNIKKAGKQNSKQIKSSLSTSHLCYNKCLFQSRWNLRIQRLNP